MRLGAQPAGSPGHQLLVEERMPLWQVLLPLFVVVAALVALVVVPVAITERNEALRVDVQETLRPLGRRLAEIERTTSAELAAARGFALTGDPFFVDRFLAVHRYGNQLETELDSLARQVGGEVQAASAELLETRAYWTQANFGQTRATFRDGMPDHQRQFEATVAAAERVSEALGRATERQMAEIRATEKLRERVSLLLGLAALIASGAALTLGWRLHRTSNKLADAAVQLQTLNDTLEHRVRKRTATIRKLARALTLAEQREREELAQILHDDLQQMLYALRLNLQSLVNRAPTIDTETLEAEAERLDAVVAQSIATTRRLTADLSPRVQADKSITEMLNWLIEHVRERFGLNVSLKSTIEWEPDEEVRIVIFRVVRELLFNVVKHAQAGSASVQIEADGDDVKFMVTDDGIGFETPVATTTIGGFGLARARERLALFGGALELDSTPGHGTRATVTLPRTEAQSS